MKIDLKSIDLEKIVLDSYSYIEVFQKVGYTSRGGSSYTRLVKRIKELGISTTHFVMGKKSIDLSSLLKENSVVGNLNFLKLRIVKAGLLKWKCLVCGIDEWNGLPISLQMDHMNGNNSDNRIENLRIICPNCHSQTHNYAGRKNKR